MGLGEILDSPYFCNKRILIVKQNHRSRSGFYFWAKSFWFWNSIRNWTVLNHYGSGSVTIKYHKLWSITRYKSVATNIKFVWRFSSMTSFVVIKTTKLSKRSIANIKFGGSFSSVDLHVALEICLLSYTGAKLRI